jgi:hypothetical protein
MINLVTDLPSNVVGLEAVGHVSADDYSNVLEPAVERALQQHDKLRLLYVLGEEFAGYSAGAAWEDAKLGISHWGAWERIAIVTDREWVRDGLRAFAWMLPGEVKVFALDARDAAGDWVSAAD